MDRYKDDYEYTKDWFDRCKSTWLGIAHLLPGRDHFLELGAYEGRSTVWTVKNLMADDSVMVSVDTWAGGEEHQAAKDDMAEVEARFDRNMERLKIECPSRNVYKIKRTTTEFLAETQYDNKADPWPFDFVYLDASHKAKDVLTDACMVWPLVKEGGLLVFDDYLYGDNRDILHRPKLAVDSFINIFSEELAMVHTGWQVIIKKKTKEETT